MEDVKVISLGGSIIAPDQVDTDFLTLFCQNVRHYLEEDKERKLILITGGGAPARRYQEAYRTVSSRGDHADQDWIGIAATRLNGMLMKSLFSDLCLHELVTNPEEATAFPGHIMVAAGWKPGFSTDFDAVVLAERFNADTVINLSNISQVYSADPKTNPGARPLTAISWAELKALVGDKWSPGINVPFDPVATARAARNRLKVITAAGTDIENLNNILRDRPFTGTTIGPQ